MDHPSYERGAWVDGVDADFFFDAQDVATGKLTGKNKEQSELNLKHSRSTSQTLTTGPQRVPLGPGRTQSVVATEAAAARPPLVQIQKPIVSKPVPDDILLVDEEPSDRMEVEVVPIPVESLVEFIEVDDSAQNDSQEVVENMVEVVSPDVDDDVDVESFVRQWPELATARAQRYRKEVDMVRERFHEEAEEDLNMCPEYADEIFEYMGELEVRLDR